VIADMVLIFVTGLAGSLHCLGMCGPLVVAYSLQLQPEGRRRGAISADLWSSGLIHHLVFHLGRITTYGLLGAFGAWLVRTGGLWESILSMRTAATLGGGALMILFGLILLKVIPVPLFSAMPSGQVGTLLNSLIRHSLASRSLGSKGLLGFAAGFLPCMLSWAVIVRAAAFGSPLTGFLSMVLFGLGTLPVLFFTGFSASILSFRVRLAGERVAALSIVIMGAILLIKGVSHFA
jgi:sulfite exporter TauE/SafE